MKSDSIKIDTVPLPEKPVSVEIPVNLLQEFERDVRIVIKHPWVIGIPVPEVLLEKLLKKPEVYQEMTKEFEIMLIPK